MMCTPTTIALENVNGVSRPMPFPGSYVIEDDPIVAMLVAEAEADEDVIGLILMGSRSVRLVDLESDYDAYFVVTDEAMAHYDKSSLPPRGHTVQPPINTEDLFTMALSGFYRENLPTWTLPMWADAYVLYDRDGAVTKVIDALRLMPEDESSVQVSEWYDTYLNSLYRSLKCWRRGNALGGRLEAVESIDALLHTLYALERRWRPYSSRLVVHLHELDGQGWAKDELRTLLLSLAATGDPAVQQHIAQRVTALLGDRGFDHILQEWHGQIEQALSWSFV